MDKLLNSKVAKLPQHYLSVDRYLLASMLTIMFAPIVTFSFGILVERNFAGNAMPQSLEGDPNRMLWAIILIPLFAVLLGWKVRLPLFITAIVAGFPLWVLSLKMLFKQPVSPRSRIFLASNTVVIVTTAVAGSVLDAFYWSGEFVFLKLYFMFLPGAIAVGSLVTQVIYGR